MTSMVAIGSGRGGVCKPWLAAGLAHALARLGRRVPLADGHTGLADYRHPAATRPGPDLTRVGIGRCSVAQPVRRFEAGGFAPIAGPFLVRRPSGPVAGTIERLARYLAGAV